MMETVMHLLGNKLTITFDFLQFILPVLCMLASVITGLMLFSKLKPGLVCELEDSCFRCQLLYGIAIGSIVLGSVSIIKDIIYFAQNAIISMHIHNYECLSSMTIKIGLFSFLSWLCIKGRSCLISNCSYKDLVEPINSANSNQRRSLLGVCSPACAIMASEALSYRQIDKVYLKKETKNNKDNKRFFVKNGRTESHSKFISKDTGL